MCKDIKSDLFDMVSDFRDRWQSTDELKRKYDSFVKDMVLGFNDSTADDNILISIVELIKRFVGLTQENLEHQSSIQSRSVNEDKEKQFELTVGERVLRKRVEIVLQVFKSASERLTRIDREWQEVLDA
jgi:hypothetical protein